MNLITETQRFSAGLAGVFLTFWLTLFCQHCTAGAMPAGPMPGHPDQQACFPGNVQAGMPDCHECHGNCTAVYARNEATVYSERLTLFTPESSALPVAVIDGRYSVSRSETPLQAFPSPDRAILHPLALNCVQLK